MLYLLRTLAFLCTLLLLAAEKQKKVDAKQSTFDAVFSQAAAAIDRQDWQACMLHLRKALELRPDNVNTLQLLGASLTLRYSVCGLLNSPNPLSPRNSGP